MNLAILQTEIKTMSSKDLLEIVNQARISAGENPVRLGDFNNRIADELDGEHYENFVVENPNGTNSTIFKLTIEQCTLVSMRESKAVRRNVLEKLKQLESQNAITIPHTLPEALRLAADLAEQNTVLAVENAQLKPKAEALDIITHAKGNQNVRDTSKVIGINQNKFVDWCIEHTWVYRDDSGRLKAHQQRINQGFMAQKSVIYEGSDGTERVTMQPMFTPKGITHLAKIHSKAVA